MIFSILHTFFVEKKPLRYRHIFKTAFLPKMYITSKSHDRFSPNFIKQASELSSFTSASSKAIVTVELAAQNAGQI